MQVPKSMLVAWESIVNRDETARPVGVPFVEAWLAQRAQESEPC